jgi:acyl-CoA thioesterase
MNNVNLYTQVTDYMLRQDLFSKWLGIVVLDVKEGYSRLSMIVRPEMLNGFGIAHGGIAFSLADSAFAFACNNRNNLSVALDTTISFLKKVQAGDELFAEATELHNGRSTGVYLITVINQRYEQVAVFKGTCFRTGEKLVNK